MAYTCVRIVQRYDRLTRYWELEDDAVRSEIIISPKNGVKVGLWRAEGMV